MAEELAHLLAAKDVPDWAKLLLRETSAIKSNMTERFETLDTKLENMEKSIKSIEKENKATTKRISNAENRISALEDSENIYQPKVDKLEGEIVSLRSQVDDLISRSKRNNSRLINVKEGVEAGGMDSFMVKILSYILDLKDDEKPPEVDRAHRALRPRPDPDQPPRPIYIRLLRWPDRQRIPQAAEKRALTWDDARFYVRQDFSPGVQQQRAAYNEIITQIKAKGCRLGILHPARLVVTIDGQRLTYSSASEAEWGLKARFPSLEWS